MGKRLMMTVWVMTAVLLGVCSVAVASEGYEFVTKWGSLGSGNGQFNYPNGIAVDKANNVYVTDADNNRIQKFTSDGAYLTKWGSTGSGDGQFDNPYGLAVDAARGYVYVADPWHYRIQKFTSDGTFLLKWGSAGTGDGQFNYPTGVAVDASGYVYVTDAGSNRIQKFNASGVFQTKWGSFGSGDGQFNNPWDVASDADNNVYVVELGGNRIQKFTSAGAFLTKWGSTGTGNGQFVSPPGVAVDADGNVYVADMDNNRIQKFTSAGAFLTKWGSYGSGNGQFNEPTSVVVDTGGNVYVTDADNNRIQKFRPEVPNHPPDAVDDSASTQQNTPVTVAVLENDSDEDGDPLTIQSVGNPTYGEAAVNGDAVDYTPEDSYTGDDSFTYTISDGNGGTDIATVLITITGSEAWQTAYRLCLPDKASLDILHRYRDQVLRSSDIGRRFVTILYRNSDEALSILLGNRQLLLSARELVSQDIDAVAQVLAGGEGGINNTDAVAAFLTAFSQKTSLELGTILVEVRNGMLKAKEEKKPFLGFRLN